MPLHPRDQTQFPNLRNEVFSPDVKPCPPFLSLWKLGCDVGLLVDESAFCACILEFSGKMANTVGLLVVVVGSFYLFLFL